MNKQQKKPETVKNTLKEAERPIASVYPVIDNDLARDNAENDLPAADREDL